MSRFSDLKGSTVKIKDLQDASNIRVNEFRSVAPETTGVSPLGNVKSRFKSLIDNSKNLAEEVRQRELDSPTTRNTVDGKETITLDLAKRAESTPRQLEIDQLIENKNSRRIDDQLKQEKRTEYIEDLKQPFKAPGSVRELITEPFTALPKALEFATKSDPVTSGILESGVASTLNAVPLVGDAVVSDAENRRLIDKTPSLGNVPDFVPFIGGNEFKVGDVTNVAANLGMTAAQYGSVNKILSGLGTESKLAQLIGNSNVGKFAANEIVDLFADVVVQAPVEWYEALTNDKTLTEDIKVMLGNRGIDVLMNLAIGLPSKSGRAAVSEVYGKIRNLMKNPDAAKAVEDSLSKMNPEQANAIKNGVNSATEPQSRFSKVLEDSKTQDARVNDEALKMESDAIEDGVLASTTIKLDDEGMINSETLDDKLFNRYLRDGYSVPEATIVDSVLKDADKYKKVGSFEKYNTDMYRQIEKVFGDRANDVKKITVDKLDNAKKLEINDRELLANSLKKDIVDGLGIKPNTKESALVQAFGEKRIDLDGVIKEVGEVRANDIVKADNWFRNKYDTILDEINHNRSLSGMKPIPKLDDYYRHFNELTATSALKNMVDNTRQISPELIGKTHYTKPKEKWMGIKQERKGGKFKSDAVGGFIEYIPSGTYAKHIDPVIPQLRAFEEGMRKTFEAAENTNMNNFIGGYKEWVDSLLGKTNFFDRTVQDAATSLYNTANFLNRRFKANAVLGNASSSLAQIANVPQGLAHVKNPLQIADGLQGYFRSLGGGGDKALYEQSGFLKERTKDFMAQFDTKLIQQPKKLAAWSLGALDKVGSEFIWSINYRKAIADGIQNPSKYADDWTRKLVGGRGIGEVPITQQSKMVQLVAPFTLEVANLWKVQKDMFKNKDATGLMMLFAGNFLMNEVLEEVRGSRVTFDPINAVMEGLEESKGENVGDKALSVAGSVGGEVLGNIPLGSAIGSVYPEYGGEVLGAKLPTREQLFGENDPTRYGTGAPLVKAIQTPLTSLITSWGGKQAKKTLEGGKALIEGFAKNRNEQIIAPVNKDLQSVMKGLLFGKYGLDPVKDSFKEDRRPLSELDTFNFEKLVSSGYDKNELFDAINEVKTYNKEDLAKEILGKYDLNDIFTNERISNKAKGEIDDINKKEEIAKILKKYYNKDEVDELLVKYYRYKKGL